MAAQLCHSGRRETLSIDVGESEIKAFWTDFRRGLVKRGLADVQHAISDAHAGLEGAIRSRYQGRSSR